MHWILWGIAAAAFAGAVFAPSPALLGVALTVGFVTLFAGFVSMVSARIAERSRPEAMLLTDADVNALRKSVREARAAREAVKPERPAN